MSNLLRSQVAIQEANPEVRPIRASAVHVSCFVGIAKKGPLVTATEILDLEQFTKIFGEHRASTTLRTAVEAHFGEGAGRCYISRTCHFTDITDATTFAAVASSLTLKTDAIATASAGAVTGTVSAPFNLEPLDTLEIHVDEEALGPDTATFTATAAILNGSAGPFDLTLTPVLNLTLNDVAIQTYTFVAGDFGAGIAAATRAEVAAAINREFAGVQAYDSGAVLIVRTDWRGSDATLTESGNASTVLGLDTGPTASTGNCANIDAVTAAEIKTIVEAACVNGTCTVTGATTITMTSDTTGVGSTIMVEVASTADDELGFDNISHAGSAASPAVDTLTVDAKYEGGWGDNLAITIEDASNAEAALFNLKVYESSVLRETWPNVSMLDTHARFCETIINDATTGSTRITVTDLDCGETPPADRPVNIAYTAAALAGGDDGIVAIADTDFVGSSAGGTGMNAFDVKDDGTLLVVPDRSANQTVSTGMIAYCEVARKGRMFALIDQSADLTASASKTDLSTRSLGAATEFAGVWWPRIKVANPDKDVHGSGETITIPNSGLVSGVMGRVASSKSGGIYENPAGEEVGKLFTALGLETEEVRKDAARDLVYPERINPITKTSGGVIYLDGSRTLKGTGNFPALAERLGATFIEFAIKAGIQFARHRNNDAKLRRQIHRTVYAFLLIQMRVGAFRSMDPTDAFTVNFGDDLNPPTEIFANRLNGEIGLATQKPAEFIPITFRQDTRDIQAELAAAGA